MRAFFGDPLHFTRKLKNCCPSNCKYTPNPNPNSNAQTLTQTQIQTQTLSLIRTAAFLDIAPIAIAPHLPSSEMYHTGSEEEDNRAEVDPNPVSDLTLT